MSLINSAASVANQLIGDVASNYALIFSPVRNIGGIFSDVTIEEVHNDRLEITQHPIQTGAVVTDHSFALPAQLTIRCGSSDSSAGYEGYVQAQYNAFLDLQASRQPFSVSTGKRLYENMLIRDIQVTTDERSDYTLMAVVNLQQITYVDLGIGSGSSIDNQMFPEQTGPTSNMGTVSLQPVAQPVTGGFVNGIPNV